jgi:hypothetical protein
VPYEWAVPEHTQYALFQLYCDLRANPIKDRHWFEVHARRLKPHTFPGWIVRLLSPSLCYVKYVLHARCRPVMCTAHACACAAWLTIACCLAQALGSALLYIASGLAISSSVALSLLAGTIYALIFLLASAGAASCMSCMRMHA